MSSVTNFSFLQQFPYDPQSIGQAQRINRVSSREHISSFINESQEKEYVSLMHPVVGSQQAPQSFSPEITHDLKLEHVISRHLKNFQDEMRALNMTKKDGAYQIYKHDRIITSCPTDEELDLLLRKSISYQFMSLDCLHLQDKVIITRPLNELISHIRNLKIPRFQLIVRVIKTLVLSIFRFHLSDKCVIFQNDKYFHSLDGKKEVRSLMEINKDYSYMIENSVILSLKKDSSPKVNRDSEFPAGNELDSLETDAEDFCSSRKPLSEESKNEEGMPPAWIADKDFFADGVTPDSIRDYYYRTYDLEITNKKIGNSIRDILNSKELMKC